MTADIWLGIGLGGALGAAYSVASYLTGRLARHAPHNRFVKVALVGMLGRMTVALVLLSLVLAAVPVHRMAFVGSFFFMFVAGLVADVFVLYRERPDTGRRT
jgi:biotin transporter BioY